MFLEKILPREGLYCVALLLANGAFRHFFYASLQDATAQISILDKGGHTVYIAQATYDPEKIAAAKAHNKQLPQGAPKADRMKIRGQVNALYMQNFFLDIDCGEKWPLKSQEEGCAELAAFVRETGLPMPSVVNSGNGLYAHWALTEPITAEKWRTVAFILKRVVAAYSPKIGGDSSRTSDSASVLRPPGVMNRKPGKDAKPVYVLHDVPPVDFLEFTKVLNAAAKKKRIDSTAVLPPKAAADLNADFYVQQDLVSDAEKIASRCSQLKLMKDSGGDVIEPLWYSCLGLLTFCVNGDAIAHAWSKDHPGYSPEETTAKIAQWRDAGMGPTTCVKFGSDNAAGCVGCPHNGKIKSPIVLGRPNPVMKDIPLEECPAPEGYRRAKDGLYREEDGTWYRFYDQDLHPSCLAYDESLGYEVMVLKHKLPYEGDMECTLRSSLVNDPKALMMALSDNHIKVVGVKEKKCMLGYLESYQARLQRDRRMTLLLCQMGWKEARNGEPLFVLGRKVFHSDGSVEDASLAKNVPRAVEGFRSAGSLEKWSKATELLDKPGMEPFAFALLAGGFGAPLMKFTGFDGALISLMGDSGAGKTLMLRFIQSVWGYHNDLMMLRDDTKNALISRLGVYGNLPLTVDEVTNIDGIELSEFVYRVTQGRDKARLTKNAEERKILNAWNTIAITSSNSSLMDKLSGVKHNASAELNRIFEYPVNKHPEFQGDVTTDLYWTLTENYGLAGEAYVRWLVKNVGSIKSQLDKMRAILENQSEAQGEERFWYAVVSVAIVGGAIAKELGIIRFSVSDVMRWAAGVIRTMRGDKGELSGDSISILAQFIDDHAANRLLVKGDAMTREGCTIVEAPRGQLVIRYEIDRRRMYIARSKFKEWLVRRFGSYTQVKTDLQKLGALTDPNKRKVLGAGTFYGGAQQPCFEIDMRCRELGPDINQFRATAEALKNAPLKSADKCKL